MDQSQNLLNAEERRKTCINDKKNFNEKELREVHQVVYCIILKET